MCLLDFLLKSNILGRFLAYNNFLILETRLKLVGDSFSNKAAFILTPSSIRRIDIGASISVYI